MAPLPDTETRVRLTRRPVEPVVMRQEWQHLLFLHWRVAPETVQARLPAGLTIDTFAGDAYIALVPFTMRNVRPVWSPAVAGLSHFHEINVRTYVYSNQTGEPGVWFFSLDAANPVAVALARVLFHLPYYTARMTLDRAAGEDGRVAYRSVRGTGESEIVSAMDYMPTGAVRTADPGSLDHFLCERYLLYAHDGARLSAGRVYHTPYPLREAVVEGLSDGLVEAAGFGRIADAAPAHIAYAGGVDVEVFGLRAVG